MNRINRTFKRLKKEERAAFIAYVTAGDPDLRTTEKIVLGLEKALVDIIELGIPFSDPLADGPIIQQASYRAIKNGATLRKIFAMTGRLRMRTDIPIVFMTYFNPVLQYGLKNFFTSCVGSGVDGVIVPDLPYDEAKELISLGRRYKVATIFLAAPTSTRKRLEKIAANSSGFIYYVSLTGVTGARRRLPADVISNVRRIKAMTDKPVAVGFGVSDAVQARMLAKVADGVIVGSAIVRIIGEGKKSLSKAKKLAAKLARAIHAA